MKLLYVLVVLVVPAILAPRCGFGAPPIPVDSHPVRAFGAVGDGIAKDTAAIQKAIDACAETGGGTVYFAPGHYLSGTIRLKDNVVLWLDAGATLLGSEEEADYDPYEELGFRNDADRETSFFNYALIRGEDVEHIGIVGSGVIDGNRSKRGGPKPIALKRCRFVEIRGIRIMNAPNYSISMLGTDYVNIDGVTILNGYSDGIDPDSCRNVRIVNCHIESVDDAIVLKTSFSLGERRSCENITVTNCYLATVCNAFKCGTESGGDFKRIAVSNCVMDKLPGGHRPARSGISLLSVDGATIDGVAISNVAMVDCRAPIFIRLGNRGRDMETPTPGAVRNVIISNVTASNASLPCSVAGIPGHDVEDVTLSDVRVVYSGGTVFRHVDEDVPEAIDAYPGAGMFGGLPAYGLYCRHARGLVLSEFHVSFADEFWRISDPQGRAENWDGPNGRPNPSQPADAGYAVVLDDVKDVSIDGFRARQSLEGRPVARFANVRGALVRGCVAREGTGFFLELAGADTRGICLAANNLSEAEWPVTLVKEAPRSALVNAYP